MSNDAIGAVAGLAFILALFGGSIAYQHATAFEEVVQVTEKYQRGGGGDSSIAMMIATEDGRTMEVADAFWHFHFRSADVYSGIREGDCYRVRGFGWRVGFFSAFPRVIAADPATCPTPDPGGDGGQ